MDTQWDGHTERRSGKDRRKQGMRGFGSIFTNRRRREVRRAIDRRRLVILDQYSGSILFLMGLVLALSLTDALFTLVLVDNGAVELNPVMEFYLSRGAATFVWVKYMLTAASVIIIVAVNYVFIPHIKLFMRDLLKLFAGGFAAVVSWELILIARFIV